MAERRTDRLTYLALCFGSAALSHQAHGVWRELDRVAVVIWSVCFAVAVIRDGIEWRWHHG